MQRDANDVEMLHLNDARVPPAVREHAMKFSQTVRYVVPLEGNEFVLLDAQGDWVDLIWLE